MTSSSATTRLPTVAVITVTYNSLPHAERFLISARREVGPGGEIVVVDNGSTDVDALKRVTATHSARLILSTKNLGYGGAMNLGVRSLPATFTHVLISNPDIDLHPGALQTLSAQLSQLEEAGAVGPRVLNEDGTVYPSARSLPSLRDGIGHALLGRVLPENRWTRSYHSESSRLAETTETGWLSGSCLMVERDAFEAVAGFDPGFFMYFEDVDLGSRLRREGWKSYYVPDAVVTHTGGHSTQGNSAAMIRAHHASAYRYMKEKYSGWPLAPLRLVLRAGLAARASWLTRRASRG